MGRYIGTSPTYGAFEKQLLIPDGVTNTFLLTYQVGSEGSLLVVYGGVVQEPQDSYSLAGGGTHIEFSFIPDVGQDLFIVYLGKELQVAPSVGGGVNFVDEELPTGAINGINMVYTTANNFITTSVKIYYNGLRISALLSDFTITGSNQFTLSFAPQVGDILVVDYRIS